MGSFGSKPGTNFDSTPLKNGADSSINIRQLESDPRSPGFVRTPIAVDKTPDLTILDPRSPTVGIVRTPIVNNEKENCYFEDDSLLVTNVIPEFEVTEESEHGSEFSVSTEVNSLSDVDESSNLLSIREEKVSKKSKNHTKTQPKQLFPVVKKTILMQGDVRRSPLSSVVIDQNSPRSIVQRKQTKKVDSVRSCGLSNVTNLSSNKENILK